MSKLYLGNLSTDVTEGTLRDLLEEKGVTVNSLLLKSGFAFVEVPDQANADKAIDSLNGFNLLGFVMQVEPSVARRSGRRSTKIQIKNLPPQASRDDIETLVNRNAGSAVKFEEGPEGAVFVTFDSPEQAQEAVTALNSFDYDGSVLKAFFINNGARRPRSNNGNSGMNRQELPLRIIVGSDYVGAIIGKQGQTIRNITSQSRARVDIHRRDNHAPETLVTIKGNPDSCSKACKEIMKVVQQEAAALNKGENPMKVLCPNHICGRIIGKKGNVIKQFMEKSGTHIVVSSISDYDYGMSDMNTYYVDRVITISGGSLDAACKAEEMLSEKMRQCYEQDAQNYNQQQPHMMFGMPPHMQMMQGYNSYPGVQSPYGYGMSYREDDMHGYLQGSGNMHPGLFGNPPVPPPMELQVTYLYIPEPSVGAVIGSKGTNIKNIMRLSNARIKIMQSTKGEEERNGESRERENRDRQQMGIAAPRPDERKVIITGNPEAQWKAQFYIFEKIRVEGYSGNDEVHLRSEIMVPKAAVGRIIGKGGQNIRELTRVSGAIVKLPEDQGEVEEVAVTIIGHFYASLMAQRRIRGLVSSQQQQPTGPQPRKPRPQQNGN
ncbi:insulin-like growth factor 2 mRNA-binding protein 2 isoform X2 [Patella vulgata]|uniref:insulin-like growth factor 2 mRNA-binding protein 2 isoform X2 n=1 Tax=Patella vulgata TaxID=6465 RepID=UPI0024A92605|nr:insulin-like growth factor 2 mRNA-binding protein 2 isoform X2 [Patella vulgata]